MKTPDQIAREVIEANYGIGTDWEEPNEHGEEGFTRAQAESDIDADEIRGLITAALDADRAQRAIPAEPSLAAIAAELVIEQHTLERQDGEDPVHAFGWSLGGQLTYEQGLALFAAAAVRVDRSQLLDPATTQTLIDITYETADGDSNDEEIAALQEARDALAAVLARITGPATYTPADTTPLTDDEIAVQASAGIRNSWLRRGYTPAEVDDVREDAYLAAVRAVKILRGETVE